MGERLSICLGDIISAQVEVVAEMWRSSPRAVRRGAKNLFFKTAEHEVESLAIPLLGAGTGGGDPEESLRIIRQEWSAAQKRPKRTEIYIFDENLYERLFWRGPWQKGLHELESQQYWEVHESWEEIWALLPDSPTQEVLQAGIQFAAACYKPEQVLAGRDEKGMQRGMSALIGSARKHLLAGEGHVSIITGLDSDVLGRALDQLEETLQNWKDGRELSLIRQRINSIARETTAALH